MSTSCDRQKKKQLNYWRWSGCGSSCSLFLGVEMNEFYRSMYTTIWLWSVSLPKSVLWIFCVTTGIKEDSCNRVGNWERCSRCRHFPFRDCLKTTQLLPPVVQYLYYLLPYRLAEWLTDSFTSLFLLGSIVITNEAIKTRVVARAIWKGILVPLCAAFADVTVMFYDSDTRWYHRQHTSFPFFPSQFSLFSFVFLLLKLPS